MDSQKVNLQLLAARVAKLEASNRRWRLANSILLLFGVSILFMGAKPVGRFAAAEKADRIEPQGVVKAHTVEAQDFVLKDESGYIYARLSVNPSKSMRGRNYLVPSQPVSSQAALQFYNERGEVLWTAPSDFQVIPAR